MPSLICWMCAQIELSLSATGLPRSAAGITPPDPVAVLYEITPNGSERELGRTEVACELHY